MAEQEQRPETGSKQRRTMLITLVVLLAALSVILVKDRAFWFNGDGTPAADEAPASVPNSVEQAPSASKPVPAAKTKNKVAAKSSVEPAVAGAAVIAANRTELPSLEVEWVAGDTHRTVHPGNNSVKVEMPPNSGSLAAGSSAFEWGPATNAAQKTLISSDKPETPLQPAESSYPTLVQQMKVQGSVLLQAFVGADGNIRDLHVLSGDPILVSAALEAARQWRFRPYLQNGQPVETQAKIMVIFTMKVL